MDRAIDEYLLDLVGSRADAPGDTDPFLPLALKYGDPTTLLIVDDDLINRAVLGNLFRDEYTIQEASDGSAALELIRADPGRFCAVLLDYRMEPMDGLTLLERLDAKGLPRRIPVFLISAEASPEVMRRAYELGVMDVIEKPVVPFVVTRRVRSVIELFAARRRLSSVVMEQQAELVRRAGEILELNRGMIETLAAAIEFRDSESGGHVRRIHDITRAFLTQTEMGAGLTDEEVTSIALASIMHDVGKIGIPDAILGKPGRLTDEEFQIMKSHTVIGAEMLENIPQMHKNRTFDFAGDIARHHHERWDGRGYPDGLIGDEQTRWAQVVSIADVYDALRCKRVYKSAIPREEACRMIDEGACGTFGPRLLDAFHQIEPQLSTFYEQSALTAADTPSDW